MPSTFVILIVLALLFAVANGVNGKIPLWISVLLVCVALLIGK